MIYDQLSSSYMLRDLDAGYWWPGSNDEHKRCDYVKTRTRSKARRHRRRGGSAEDVVHRQAVGVERDPVAEPGLRVLPGKLRRDPEGRAVLLPGQPRLPRRCRHEPLLRLQRPPRLELLLQQFRARRPVRPQLWILHVLLRRRSPPVAEAVQDEPPLMQLRAPALFVVEELMRNGSVCSHPVVSCLANCDAFGISRSSNNSLIIF